MTTEKNVISPTDEPIVEYCPSCFVELKVKINRLKQSLAHIDCFQCRNLIGHIVFPFPENSREDKEDELWSDQEYCVPCFQSLNNK